MTVLTSSVDQFTVAIPSKDGLLYVCDRGSDRIQVFRPDGTYVREVYIAPETLAQGSTWDISLLQ